MFGTLDQSEQINISIRNCGKIPQEKAAGSHATRWNSFYEALCRIIDIPITDLHNLCTQLGIRCITDREYQFIKEYCVLLKPLAMALNILQGEENCFYGTILPTLEALMAKTLDLKDSLSRMTSGLACSSVFLFLLIS